MNLLKLKIIECLNEAVLERNIPVLGICLGSQLIAKTFGAKVYRGSHKEIGFYNDLKIQNEVLDIELVKPLDKCS